MDRQRPFPLGIEGEVIVQGNVREYLLIRNKTHFRLAAYFFPEGVSVYVNRSPVMTERGAIHYDPLTAKAICLHLLEEEDEHSATMASRQVPNAGPAG